MITSQLARAPQRWGVAGGFVGYQFVYAVRQAIGAKGGYELDCCGTGRYMAASMRWSDLVSCVPRQFSPEAVGERRALRS